MDATAKSRAWEVRRLWKRYRGTVFVLLTCLAVVLSYRTVSRTALLHVWVIEL